MVEHPEWPYFVYGTCRPGMGNEHIWQRSDAIAKFDGECYVEGYSLCVMGLPYAIKDDGGRLLGALIYPASGIAGQQYLRWRFDSLEGHPDHYERVPVAVYTPFTIVQAWIYTPTRWNPANDAMVEGYVEHGDYKKWRNDAVVAALTDR